MLKLNCHQLVCSFHDGSHAAINIFWIEREWLKSQADGKSSKFYTDFYRLN